MLQLKKLGIDDLVHFDFMDPPGDGKNTPSSLSPLLPPPLSPLSSHSFLSLFPSSLPLSPPYSSSLPSISLLFSLSLSLSSQSLLSLSLSLSLSLPSSLLPIPPLNPSPPLSPLSSPSLSLVYASIVCHIWLLSCYTFTLVDSFFKCRFY